MDFDEYDYLEKAVDVTRIRKDTGQRSSRHHPDGEKGGKSRDSKRSRTDENGGTVDRDGRDRSDRREKDYRRSGDKERERERDQRERGMERDKENDKHREREKEKDRHRERGKEKDRHRESEKERTRDREGEKEIDLDRERERSRRSRSSSRRHDVEYLKEKKRSRSREMREQGERDSRESRRFRDKKEQLEPEVDPERDQRTVFAYQMPLKANERDVYEFFSKAGKQMLPCFSEVYYNDFFLAQHTIYLVRDVRLIMDRNSRRSKGVGYIEFYDAMSVPMAIALSGHQLSGQPVMVKPSEAEKNLVQSNTGGGLGAAGARKIYVGNLHFNINEDLLRQVFEPFGQVELVQLPLDPETGHCRGYGFIQFSQVEYAKAAQSLNGKLDIAGRIIKVSAVTENIVSQESGTNATDFDDDDGGGLSMNARSRAMLMQKLDRTGTASSIVESLGVPALNGGASNQPVIPLPRNGQVTAPATFPVLLPATIPEPIGDPSEFILLKNLFHPSTETDPDFDLDIKEDVREECAKFGPLKHIYVDKYCENGSVYMRFESLTAAASCQRAMHMRWFAGRSISATFMRPQDYEAKLTISQST